MNNLLKMLIFSLFLFFTSSNMSRAAENVNLTWLSMVLGKTYSNPSSCDAMHLDLCSTESTCTGAGGYWYNDTCNTDPSFSCDETHLDLCSTESTCTGAGGYWYNDTCNVEAAYDTVTSAGLVWMDRNLGASRVAESSTDTEAYGDLYQWGRGTDGHEKRTSTTTSDLSTSDIPGHDQFITNSDLATFNDWRTPQNDALWQDVDGINNPCPSGFRLPTNGEFTTEILSWASNNAAGAFGSPTKLVAAGSRSHTNGSVVNADNNGVYWSSSVGVGGKIGHLFFSSNSRYVGNANVRADGYSVRCIQD